MPGFHHWPLDAAFVQIAEARITRIICLEEASKMLDRSPAYYGALERGETPAPVTWHPVVDYGVPEDLEAYLGLVREIADALRAGERVLVHCAGGCGRSGTFASLVLVALGADPESAEATYRGAAGCGPESRAQRALVRRGLSVH
jgi:protein tyrosine phosphatase